MMEKLRPPPESLSHYTSISGLMGIVTSRRLWASNASFLNDRSELLHALNAARTAIEKLSSSTTLKRWEPTLEKVVKELEEGKIPDTYVACFCGSADNLSQWRGYSGPDKGVSVTFDRRRLADRLHADGAKLYRVTYAKITTPTKVRDALKGEFADLADLDDLGELAEARSYEEVLDAFPVCSQSSSTSVFATSENGGLSFSSLRQSVSSSSEPASIGWCRTSKWVSVMPPYPSPR